MKKNILIFGCMISCLILVSISYQPIIAEKPIIENTKLKKVSLDDLDIEEYKEFFYRILNMNFQSDCDCLSNKNDNTLICYALISILFVLYSLFFVFNLLYNIQALQQIIQYLASHLESFTKIIHDWAIYYDCVGGFP
ncbi:hypothetical protein ACFL1L_02290 [Thermoplasmatota archaeon]